MKKIYLLVLAVFISNLSLSSQNMEPAFQEGEWFQFRIHYGLFNAGYATLEVVNDNYKSKPVYHVKGYGETTGVSRIFFKVEDKYETYVDKNTILPYKFIRKIDEGGHTKDKIVEFDQNAHVVHINDIKHKKKITLNTEPSVHDMISSFYYLRDKLDTSTLKEGDEMVLNMFFDEENFKFKLKYLGKEVIRTKFGKVKSLIFRPYVQAGRVFKEQESLTIWVSDDKNKIPLRVKADLAVGSVKADIEAFKGLKNPFVIIQD
ncbi:DUF3108 domain-containing protein [Leeuwenhoekiella sp. A16]|uniref:DUF3108 domain-containing protein n=1 Tax=unclassified Leeuwenhoekiella TaxID=2615029 RepID=UPI003A7F866E